MINLTAIMTACTSGDLFLLEELSHKPNFLELYQNEDLYCTPFWLACRYGHLHIAKWFAHHPLLELHINMNAPSQGTTPLQEACRQGHLDVVQWLYPQLTLFGNVYPNGLHEAVFGQHLPILEWLCANNANINHKSGHESDTPLHVACRIGSLPIVKRLHSLGAFIDLLNHEGNTPLLLACYHGFRTIVQYLHSYGANLHLTNYYDESAVWLTCESGNLYLLKWLHEHHASLHKSDRFGRLPLSRAAYRGHTHIIHWLAPFVNINHRDFTGDTAMIEACREGHLECAKYLYSIGASIQIPDNLLHDPLHYACEWNHTRVVSWLCSLGVSYCPYRIQVSSDAVQEILFLNGAFYHDGILTFISPALKKILFRHYRQRQLPLQKNIVGFDALMDSLPLCSDVGTLIGEYTGIVRGPAWSYLLDL